MKTLKILAVTVFAALTFSSAEASLAPVNTMPSTKIVVVNSQRYGHPRHRVVRRRVVRKNVHFETGRGPVVNRRVVVQRRVYHNRPVVYRRY
jgi:hypothetical protein